MASATTLQFVLDSSALAGMEAQLAFDFTNGDNLASNTVIISAFSTDGSLGTASSSGGVSGTLPGTVTLTDTAEFSELLQPIILDHDLDFTLTLTENRSGLTPFPDSFSFFLLDAAGMPLFDTSDLTGANALFSVDITGTATGNTQVYSAINSIVNWSVTSTAIPAPSAVLLFSLGLCCLVGYRRAQIRLFILCQITYSPPRYPLRGYF